MMKGKDEFYPNLYNYDYATGPINNIQYNRELAPKHKSKCPCGDRWILNFCLNIIFIVFLIVGMTVDKQLQNICIFIYIFSLLDGIFCETPKFLRNISRKICTGNMLEYYKGVGPVTIWKIRCYHTETSYSNESNSRGGNSFKSRSRDVITHRAEHIIYHKYWTDSSPIVNGMNQSNLIRLYSTVNISFLDPNLQVQFNSIRAMWIKHHNRDVQFKFEEIHKLPELNKYTLCYNTKINKLLNIWNYICCAIFGITWVMRFYLWKTSFGVKYNYVKVIHQLNNEILNF